jgi:hypothetical protein
VMGAAFFLFGQGYAQVRRRLVRPARQLA